MLPNGGANFTVLVVGTRLRAVTRRLYWQGLCSCRRANRVAFGSGRQVPVYDRGRTSAPFSPR